MTTATMATDDDDDNNDGDGAMGDEVDNDGYGVTCKEVMMMA